MTDRTALRRTYGPLFGRVVTILYEEDPVGLVKCGMPKDEYVPEAGTILPRLSDANSVQDVEVIVYEEFCRWLAHSAGRQEDYRTSAARIWEAWCSYKTQKSTDILDWDDSFLFEPPLPSKTILNHYRRELADCREALQAYSSGKRTHNVVDGKLIDTTDKTIADLKTTIVHLQNAIEFESSLFERKPPAK